MIVQALVLLLFIYLLYVYSTQNSDYWEKRNVKHLKCYPFFLGHLHKLWSMWTAVEYCNYICDRFPNEKMIGAFIGTEPALILNDTELIKQVCAINFESFYARAIQGVNEKDPMMVNLFHGSGDKWKLLKQRLSGAFTSKKLQAMYPLIVKCAQKLQTVGDDIVKRGGVVDAYNLMSKFTMEFIGACGMGINVDVIDDEDSQFFQMTKQSLVINRTKTLFMMICNTFPFLNRSNFYVLNVDVKSFYVDLLTRIRKERNFKPCGRNDFIDYLLELEALGKIRGESMEMRNPDGSPVPIELDFSDQTLLAAQVLVFYIAGYETSASSTSYTLHQLACHPDIQRGVQKQIDEVLQEYDNKICYEAVKRLDLLEMAYLESLRIFPPAGILTRICTKQYTFPGTKITIDPGVKIYIPAHHIHMDEKYYDNPNEFRPERFSRETSKRRSNFEFMPFGIGPRMCIGSRLGLMQSLAGLTAVLQRFNVELASTSTRDIKIDRNVLFVQRAKGGLPIKLTPRKKDN